MKLQVAHPAQPSAVDEHIDRYLASTDGQLTAGLPALLAYHPGPANFAAFGAIIRAGIQALGAEAARDALRSTLRRGGRR